MVDKLYVMCNLVSTPYIFRGVSLLVSALKIFSSNPCLFLFSSTRMELHIPIVFFAYLNYYYFPNAMRILVYRNLFSSSQSCKDI